MRRRGRGELSLFVYGLLFGIAYTGLILFLIATLPLDWFVHP